MAVRSVETSAPVMRAAFLDGVETVPEGVLGGVVFGDRLDLQGGEGVPPVLTVPMARSAGERFVETWTAGPPTRYGTRGNLVFAEDGEYLFMATTLPEAGEYDQSAESRYRQMFELINELGYAGMFRIWNYIGDLLTPLRSGLQIYQDFVKGRARAFAEYGGTSVMPAATGIGTRDGGVGLVALASRTGTATHVENPRQTPAYEYPQEYGPKSPSFARATVLTHGDDPATSAQSLFVSGTASIVGHESVHPGDFAAQLETTLSNFEALLDGDNLARFNVHAHFDLSDARLMKVYVKHASDMDEARRTVRERVGSGPDVRYLNVDVCRDELLVEIEASFPHIPASSEGDE